MYREFIYNFRNVRAEINIPETFFQSENINV